MDLIKYGTQTKKKYNNKDYSVVSGNKISINL